jgi:hypothetical protein
MKRQTVRSGARLRRPAVSDELAELETRLSEVEARLDLVLRLLGVQLEQKNETHKNRR